jgi:hypothetical protein
VTLTKIELAGRSVEALLLDAMAPPLRRAIAALGDRPFVVMPDDGEIVPALAVIGRAYAAYAEKTTAARAAILSDRAKATRRAELTDELLAALRAAAGAVDRLGALYALREVPRILAELPELLQPTAPASAAAQEKPAA